MTISASLRKILFPTISRQNFPCPTNWRYVGIMTQYLVLWHALLASGMIILTVNCILNIANPESPCKMTCNFLPRQIQWKVTHTSASAILVLRLIHKWSDPLVQNLLMTPYKMFYILRIIYYKFASFAKMFLRLWQRILKKMIRILLSDIIDVERADIMSTYPKCMSV